MFNLKELAGKEYKVQIDPAFDCEKYAGKYADIAYYYEIHGLRGWLYPYDSERIAVEVTPKRAGTFGTKFPGASAKRTTADGTTYLLAVKDLPAALKFIKAKKRRQLTAAQRLAAAQRFAASKEKPHVDIDMAA